ncbi:amidohydrolase family protein [Cellvibrio japonicus]|nr:hypothetical protein [Cellvibrio japonicus]QEI13341.1 hypothetical protein FY117_14650 [Cellvibrio japonicus]QEI16915.1 hypothetical protein FY116_14655 [Cellvibrio japonicus]QEI20493.1 hypothetical protein FY115_14650 [Cellvibrio japonicus]
MSSHEVLGTPTPNYSSIDADQSGYCSSMSEDLAGMSMPDTSMPATEDPATEESAPGVEDALQEDESTESSDDGEGGTEAVDMEAESEEESLAEEAGTDTEAGEETEEESEENTSEESGEAASDDTASKASNTGGGEEENQGIEVMVAKVPRMAPIRTPYVASAPAQAIERRDEIIKRTGSPPELHHARVRQTVEQVAQAARDAQRRMVWTISNIARDSRLSIEQMAGEIIAATSAAVAQINGAIDSAMADIDAAALERTNYMDGCTLLTGDALEANRNFTNKTIADNLTSGSEDVNKLNDVATKRFDIYRSEAEGKIFTIPEQGAVGRIASPSSEGSSGGTSPPQPGERTADYQIMAHADESLTSFIDTQSRTLGRSRDNTSNYYSFRSTPVLQGMEDHTQTQLVQGAQQKAETLSSESTRAQFLVMLLGLTTPVSQHHEQDQTQAVDENERQLLAQMTETEAAHYQANKTINQKRDLAKEYANRDLRENLTNNLWKAGNKGAKSLRKQAVATEVALNNNAAPMAEAYRDLVTRLNALLPPGQFLDSRDIVPKLITARDNARHLQAQHETAAKEQAIATEAQMQLVKKQQIEGLIKAAHDSQQSIQDVVTQTGFDMEVFVMQMTGSMREGAGACMAAAQDYANRTAEGILKSITESSGPGMDRVNTVAVSFLNGQIGAAEQAQYQQLAAFVETMEREGNEGPLTKPMFDAQEDLHTRSTALDNAMPERSTGTAIALGLASPIAMGVYLYCTDASENTVVTQLGGLMWPGILALEEVFEQDQHHGSLRGRINDRLDNPEKTDALNLFSTSEDVRADARMSIINNSTHWYSDYNRESREAVLSGMSGSERATLDASQLDQVRQTITGDLDVHQRDIALAYLEGNRERAVAARTREALDKGVSDARWGWIFSAEEAQRRSDQARVDAIAGMDAMLQRELAVENALANSNLIDGYLSASSNQVYREFASLRDPRGRSASSFSAEEGRRSMINYATESHTSAVLNINPLGLAGVGPLLYATPEKIQMSGEASRYIEAAVMHGSDSNEARSARGVYEIARAHREGGSPSETTQTRLSDALENRTLATLEREFREARTPQERSRAERRLAEERARHRGRLQEMARALGAPADVASDPAAAEAWMSNQVGDLFAQTDSIFQSGPSHRRYGEEMIAGGRASLDATVALATDGIGTHDDLLTRGYTDRSHAEIDAANQRWADEHGGESMEAMLGLRNGRDRNNSLRGTNSWWSTFGAETSGDQAMGLEILALGNPENDMDRIAIANLRYEHQRVRGTGFIAERSMAGTDEQRFLDGSRVDMARVILDEAVRRNPELAGRFDDNPLAIFNADGSINSDIAGAAFDKGNFRGSATVLQNATAHIGYAADAYRAEIDRQESMLTTGITVLALIASIALMCIPGVNVVAAGIISAVIAGAATIAVKAGMRGERYGWEEAATDVATTAIEVATAGIGGALAGGLGKAGMAGRLAKIGDIMVARLGKVGGAVAREAIVSAVSSAASTAIQDDTWKDGLSSGLGRLANSAIRGAVVSAVSTGVSESLTAKLNTRMNVGDVDPANMSRWQKMATSLGPHGSEMIREGLSNGIGTFASEAVGITIDYAQGNFHGDFGDALKQIGMATLRETASSAARGGVTSLNRERYRTLLDVARRGGPMSAGDLRALRLFAISAGAMNYDSDLGSIRREVDAARDLLSRMPPGLREHASAMDVDSLHRLVDMLGSADLGELKDLGKKAEFLRELGESVPGLDTRALMAELENAISRRTPADTEATMDVAQQNHLRAQLGSNLHEGLKFALDDVRMDGLQHLSDAELTQAATMIASGKFNSAEADALMRAAKARNPELDEFGFLSNLQSAVKNSERAQTALRTHAEARRQQILELVPADAAPVFTHMDDADIAIAQRLIRAGDPGTPQQQDALFRAAKTKNPDLTRDQFHQFMAKAAGEMRTRLTAEANAKRVAREHAMTNVPEHLRATLSALPEAGLVELRLRQQEGSLSPAEKIRLIEMAKRAIPEIDVRQLSDAIDQAIAAKPATRISESEVADLRKHLLSGVPEDQRTLIQNTPIMVLSDAEFAAMTRSGKGQAVTLIIDGKPVIVMREGANPRVLREEGIHALQANDPQWAKHIGSLDEQHLANWDQLPLEQQLILYRNKVALELDAQQRLISSIEVDIANAKSPQEKAALQRQLAQTRQAHTNLSKRMSEVGNMDAIDIANIKTGFSERPQWLDQPARLFNKTESTETVKNPTDEDIRISREHVEKKITPEQHKILDQNPEHKKQVVQALAEMSARGINVDVYLSHYKDAGTVDLLRAAPLLAKVASGVKDLNELLGIIHFVKSLDTRLTAIDGLPKAGKNKILQEIMGADINQLRQLLPRLEIIIQLARVQGPADRAGVQAADFIKGMRRLVGLPMADLHVHTTSLVSVTDIVQWVSLHLKEFDVADVSALTAFLTKMALDRKLTPELIQALSDWQEALKNKSPDSAIFRHLFEVELHRIVDMSINPDQKEQQLSEFFAQFQTLKKFVSGEGVVKLREIMEIAIKRYMEENVGVLELRGEHTRVLEGSDTIQKLLTLLGGVIATSSRGSLSMTSFAKTLENAANKLLFLGFDISGQEKTSLMGRLSRVVLMAQEVANHNVERLSGFIKKENLSEALVNDVAMNKHAADQLNTLIKETGMSAVDEHNNPLPLGKVHENLVAHLQQKIREAEVAVINANGDQARQKAQMELLNAVGHLNRYNKILVDALQRMDAFSPAKRTGNNEVLDIVGMTIHAGEQVARKVESDSMVLGKLMEDIEIAIMSGTNRIGHGVILGLDFSESGAAATMTKLGFEWDQAAGVWRRGGESYNPRQLQSLEKRRLEALQRVVHQGITLEVPPTSNIILNNLGLESHPVLKMMQDVKPPPVLRVSVSTDNPGVHNINPHSELALLISMGVDWPAAVRIVTEGFASRMGNRPIVGPDGTNVDIREKMVHGILDSTPLSEAPSVLNELALRYPNVIKENPIPASLTKQEFELWLRRFVIAAMGNDGQKTGLMPAP